MTVTVNSRRREYQGNGVTTEFNGPMAYVRSHVLAYLVQGNTMTLVPSSAYNVEKLGNNTGTRVIMTAPPAANQMLLLLRVLPYSQDVDITNQGAFYPETVEKGFDALAMQIQQLDDGSMQLVFEDGEFVWDAKGSRIVRVGDPKADMDAVNLRYMRDYVAEHGGGGGGGDGSVTPLMWDWVGDGVTTSFPIPGADVANVLFFDTAMEQVASADDYFVLKPGVDFTVSIPADHDESRIILTSPPAAGIRGFTVLRGYSRPYAGNPIETVAPVVVSITGDTIIDGSYHNHIIEVNESVNVTLTVRPNSGSAELDWEEGGFFSVRQRGSGKVFVVGGSPATVEAPAGYSNETRGVRAFCSFTCLDSDTSRWGSSGDLLRNSTLADKVVFVCPLSEGTADVTSGTSKYVFRAPFDMVLDVPKASVTTAQASGGILTVDINVDGATILSTKLTIDNAEKSSATAATPPVLTPGGQIVGNDQEITIDVDQVGVAGAKGLKAYIVGTRA